MTFQLEAVLTCPKEKILPIIPTRLSSLKYGGLGVIMRDPPRMERQERGPHELGLTPYITLREAYVCVPYHRG